MKPTLAVVLLFSALAPAQKPGPPTHFSSDPNNSYADGRWVSSQGKALFPSETQLNCMRQWSSCIAATAELYMGHPHVSIEYFQVVQWDESGLVAVNADATCMKRTMVVSFSAKSISVSGALKNIPNEMRKACATIGSTESYLDHFVLKNSQEWNAQPYGASSQR
jgi:hypothetical protein